MCSPVEPPLKCINRMVSLTHFLCLFQSSTYILKPHFHFADYFSRNLLSTFGLESCRMMKDVVFYVRPTTSIAFKSFTTTACPGDQKDKELFDLFLLTDLLQEQPRPCHFYKVSCQMLILKPSVIREEAQTRAKSVFRQIPFTCLDLNYIPGTHALFLL